LESIVRPRYVLVGRKRSSDERGEFDPLDAGVRETLEAEANARGIGFATHLREMAIDPTPKTGCTQRCFALAPCVTSALVKRMRATPSRITDQQLHSIWVQMAAAIGSV
jgi:hypothetical protein